MDQIERVFIGSCCFLAGTAFSNIDVYLCGLILIAWTILACAKQVLRAISKLNKGLKNGLKKGLKGKIKGSKNKVININGDNNVVGR